MNADLPMRLAGEYLLIAVGLGRFHRDLHARPFLEQLGDVQGLRTLRGKPFTKNSLDTILKNEKYTGVYIYEDIRVEGGMPQIIDPETFAKVQEMLKEFYESFSHREGK